MKTISLQAFRGGGQKACQPHERNSNLELLRIISMFGIVLGHFLVFGLETFDYFPMATSWFIYMLFHSSTVIAVNCFIMISGYFGIKLEVRKVAYIYFICLFYGLGIYLVSIFTGHATFSFKELIPIFFPLSHSYWFIIQYTYLMFFSPLLNQVVRSADPKTMNKILFSLLLLNIYFGYIHRGSVNPDGYNVMNFILIYLIGAYIRRYIRPAEQGKRIKYLWGYIACTFTIFCMALGSYLVTGHLITMYVFGYNNPIVLLSASCILCLFLTIRMQSRPVNRIASTMFAVYVAHSSIYLAPTLWNAASQIGAYISSPLLVMLCFATLTLGIMIIIFPIDIIRQHLYAPIERMIKKKFNYTFEK